jgi:hypothetical protein
MGAGEGFGESPGIGSGEGAAKVPPSVRASVPARAPARARAWALAQASALCRQVRRIRFFIFFACGRFAGPAELLGEKRQGFFHVVEVIRHPV